MKFPRVMHRSGSGKIMVSALACALALAGCMREQAKLTSEQHAAALMAQADELERAARATSAGPPPARGPDLTIRDHEEIMPYDACLRFIGELAQRYDTPENISEGSTMRRVRIDTGDASARVVCWANGSREGDLMRMTVSDN